jgi:CRP-like cAMP-binding protein
MSAARYGRQVVEAGSAIALPELTRTCCPAALYRVRDRHGVGVIALPGGALTEGHERALLQFRFAQYLAAGFVDPELAHRRRMRTEPLSEPEPDTISCVAFSYRDGRVLAHLALRAPASAPPGTTLRTRERPLLPFEEHFGWGALNRLQLLPDVPLDRIRELGRFVKNHRPGAHAELVTRAVLEVCVAGFHVLTGPLRTSVDAFVGEFEDVVARRHLEFLHTPFVMLRGGLPAFAAEHFLAPALDGRARYPFAGWLSDLTGVAERLRAIEAALAIPGDAGLVALARLRADAGTGRPSSLEPPGGVPALANTALPQRKISLEERLRARARGHWLRAYHGLAGLSETEATTLHTLLEEVTVPSGARAVTRGGCSDAMYLIGHGQAEVRGWAGAQALGPGELFGEIGLLTGRPRSADVVARTPLRLLRLGRETFSRYLASLPDVADELRRLALSRAAAQLGAAP